MRLRSSSCRLVADKAIWRRRSAEERGLLSVKFMDTYIGSGVFANQNLKKGELVCFYEGDLISGKEGLLRFCSLPKQQGSYLFFFRHNGQEFCIDATHSTGCGRMLNDSRKPNCKVVVEDTEVLRLAIYTLKNISQGSELRFDYNDSTAFWRRKNAAREIIYRVPGPDSIKTDAAIKSEIETSEAAEVVCNKSDHESFIGPDLIETDDELNSQIETSEAAEVILNQTGHESFIGCDSIETDEAVKSQIETSMSAEVIWNQRDHESVIGPDSIETDEEVNSRIEMSKSAEVILNQTGHESFIGCDSIETDEAVKSQIETSMSAEVIWNQRDHESVIGPDSIETDEEVNSRIEMSKSAEVILNQTGHESFIVEYAATAESSGTDEDGEVAETDATAGNCDKDEGGEIHVAENVDMAGNCDKDEGGEIHVAENVDTAGNCGIDEGDDIHVAENVDMAGNCDIDEGDEIHVAENVDMAGNCDIDEGVEIHVAENVDTAGNCDIDDSGEILVGKNVDTAGNCDIDEGDEIHVAENVDMAGNCDLDEGVEIHIAENVDTALNCDIDDSVEIHVAENVDMAGNCDIDDSVEIHVAENVDAAGNCGIAEGVEIHKAENVDTTGNCDINEGVEIHVAENVHTAGNCDIDESSEKLLAEIVDKAINCGIAEGVKIHVAENVDIAGNCDIDNGGEILVGKNVDTARNCDIDEGGEIHVAENIDRAGNCEIDDGGEIHVAENVDTAWKCDNDESSEINVAENVDTAGNLDIDEGGDIHVAKNVDTARHCYIGRFNVKKVIENVDTAGKCDNDESSEIQAAKNFDTSENCGTDKDGEIVENDATAGNCDIYEVGEKHVAENVDTAGNCDKDKCDENESYTCESTSDKADFGYSDGENNLNDSFEDPDYVPPESEDSESSDTSEEGDSASVTCSYRNRQKATAENHYRQKSTLKKTRSVYSDDSDCIPDSLSESESVVIPDISRFLSVPDEYDTNITPQSDENHVDGFNQSRVTVPKKSSASSTSGFGLLPKQPIQSGCKQVYDKINYCTFCRKAIRSKISRHLLSVHKSESRVIDVAILPKRSKERMVKLEVLANEGNFKHNIEVLKNKDGYLVVGRRENNIRDFKIGNYLPCDFCKKFILKTTLWLHHRNCSVARFMNNSNEAASGSENHENVVRLSRRLLNSALLEESEKKVEKLLSRMRHDDVTEEVRNDTLIKRYAALKVESLGRQQDQKLGDMHRVSQSCRTLARLVIECREKSEHIVDLNKLITPSNFDLVVSTTKSLCCENGTTSPSLGRLVGHNLAHIIQVKKGIALRNNDNNSLQQAENFQKLFLAEWNYRVNAFFKKMTDTINRQKVKTIPLTEDLLKLRNYMLKEMKNESASLQKEPCAENWTRLAKLTLCRLILFNKRRRAEVKDLKLEEFETRPNWQDEHRGEFKMALTTSARMLSERMDMVISAGKSKKNVDAYVIMPPDTKQAVNLLNTTRQSVGIATSNPYIFARLNSDSPLSGNTDLNDIVAECPGLQHPERITSTGLRRYIATVSQILDMSNTELESLARHLGHDVQTHKENYRLSHATRELTVVSQLLIAVDSGLVNKWKGKRLADISVDELPDVPEDEDDIEDDLEQNEDTCPVEEAEDLPVEDCEDLPVEDCEDLPVEDCEDLPVEEAEDLPVEDAVGRHLEEAISKPPKVVKSSAVSRGKRSVKRPWSTEEEEHLRKKFKFYLGGSRFSVHNDDMIAAQQTCDKLSRRTLAQIRAKLNNMKLGKSR